MNSKHFLKFDSLSSELLCHRKVLYLRYLKALLTCSYQFEGSLQVMDNALPLLSMINQRCLKKSFHTLERLDRVMIYFFVLYENIGRQKKSVIVLNVLIEANLLIRKVLRLVNQSGLLGQYNKHT